MAFANAAAALNCTRLGARAGIARLADILQLAEQAAGADCSGI
jgi:sugar/nucleoside kinase (ribokinase family)